MFAVYVVFTSTACPNIIDHSKAEQEKTTSMVSQSLLSKKKKEIRATKIV